MVNNDLISGNTDVHDTRSQDQLGVCETVDAVRRGDLSARTAVESCLAEIERHNGRLNAVVILEADRALERADTLDANRAAGNSNGPLDGLPVTIKEAFDVAGMVTSWGNPEFKDNIATRDSAVAQRLKDAGAVVLGKTNLPQGMEDWETDNANYGATRNPRDTTRSAGGSSGGGAAAVAAGLVPVDIGSDTGGSIRIPAHYCGVYGIKPTYKLTPVAGHALADDIRDQDMNTAGPLCRSPEDIGLIMSVIAGAGEFEVPGWSINLPQPEQRQLSSYRFAALLDHSACPIDRPYLDVMQNHIENLRRLGVTVDIGVAPNIDFVRATEIMNLMVRSEGSTRLSDEAFRETQSIAAEKGTLEGRAYLARLNAQGRTLTHRDWLKLHEERLQIRRVWDQFFTQYDAFLCPVSSSSAPPLMTNNTILDRTIIVNGEEMPMLKQHFWSAMAVLPYIPALTMPIGQTSARLPVGIDLTGPAFHDLRLAGMAAQIRDGIRSLGH